MEHLIDKSALVAEIDRKRDICKKVVWDLRSQENKDYYQGKAEAYKETIDILDTLEVKDVDINEEAKRKWDSFPLCYDELRGCDVIVWPYWVYKQVCKYFFELGLKAQKGE